MGHEIAHAIAKHGNERVSQQLIAEYGAQTLSGMMSGNPGTASQVFNAAVGIGGQLGLLKFSRQQESEADEMGLIFMAMAGYDPNEAVAFWQRMTAQGGAKPPELLSTHPSDATRIADIKKMIPKAMQYYKAG
jgi:predicted Zn-dependent protease